MWGWVAAAVAAHQGFVMLGMHNEQAIKFADATETARSLNKPLLVVGGPLGSPSNRLFGIKAHGCGDMCADIDPLACQGCPFTEADVRNLPFANKEFGAAFCSHVLEHMPTPEDCATAWNELHRVADSVFVCFPPKSSIVAWLNDEHHLWVRQESEDTLRIEDRHSPRVVYAKTSAAPASRCGAPAFDLLLLTPA